MSEAHDFERFLEDCAQRIDAHFERNLPSAGEPPQILHEAMRYAVFSGGKRLRPALVFAAAHACELAPERAAPLAAAVELVHTYSLVHDDLPAMDDDDLRRGRPTVHVKFGEANAILVGDALLAAAFEELARAEVPIAIVGRLARAAGSRELVGGQVDDLAFAPERADAALVRAIHERKTAALFRFSVWAPGVAAARTARELASLDAFGLAYGLAFQLVDDLLDGGRDECSILCVADEAAARVRVREETARALALADVFGAPGVYLRAIASASAGRLR
ncbi:MAG TPA: polyprenyl synthetase family protein [Myxococcota bacterium]|nr:polyprenyl synthetase family protein [Myxococcota bacterium]